ncbi:MAG TPA: hypothetical protein VK699_15850 [Terriglobales bacterium]|nr:hypothetical protein [Terriglobales bacterium]
MRHALVLAVFAALGFIFEVFVVKEKLFSSGKDEISPAVNAFESLVLEFHERPTSPVFARPFPHEKAPVLLLPDSAQRRSLFSLLFLRSALAAKT